MSNSISQEQKNIFAHNLNKLLSENGKTQSDLVTHFGITASTVSDWCNAKKYPRVDKMQMLADYFGVKKSDLTERQKSLDEVLEELEKIFKEMSNEKVPFRKVLPVFQSVKLVNNNFLYEGFVKNIFIDEVEDFENHIALLIPNDDLEPEFTNNDIAIIHQQNTLENNKYFYVIIDESFSFIRKVTFSNSDNIILKADNPKLDVIILPKEKMDVVGKVVFIQKNKKL